MLGSGRSVSASPLAGFCSRGGNEAVSGAVEGLGARAQLCPPRAWGSFWSGAGRVSAQVRCAGPRGRGVWEWLDSCSSLVGRGEQSGICCVQPGEEEVVVVVM